MDRAGMLRTYWSVVLPISAPAFVVTAIWQFTSIWNDFLFAVFLITNPSSWPVTVALNNTTGSLVAYNVQMAAALIASLPTLIVYILLGRYFMRGLMAGALKARVGRHGRHQARQARQAVLERVLGREGAFARDRGGGAARARRAFRVRKTTALRMIAGLEDISEGDLYISGTRVNDVLERDRDIAMVFQNTRSTRI